MMMMPLRLGIAFVVLLACACSTPTTSPPSQEPTASSDGAEQPPATDVLAASTDADAGKSGKAYKEGNTCEDGLTCISFFGLTGNDEHVCEVSCESSRCPDGMACQSYDDGPSNVCRHA